VLFPIYKIIHYWIAKIEKEKRIKTREAGSLWPSAPSNPQLSWPIQSNSFSTALIHQRPASLHRIPWQQSPLPLVSFLPPPQLISETRQAQGPVAVIWGGQGRGPARENELEDQRRVRDLMVHLLIQFCTAFLRLNHHWPPSKRSCSIAAYTLKWSVLLLLSVLVRGSERVITLFFLGLGHTKLRGNFSFLKKQPCLPIAILQVL
jgi:hypothetical protein